MGERNIAEELFGKVEKIGVEVGGEVVPEKILAPFEEKDSIVRMFCENCEGHYEISQEVADDLLSEKTSKDNFEKGEYISVDGCAVCKKDRTDVSIKKISIH